MHIPKVEERSIISASKNGYMQYSLTLPKKFADTLRANGITSLHVMYGENVLIAFSSTIKEDELMALLKLHTNLEKLLAKEA